MTTFKHTVSKSAKIHAGVCETGNYIRIESRGMAIVLFLDEAQAKTLKTELPK